MNNTNLIKAIRDIYSDATWNAIAENAHESQMQDILKSLEILNSAKLGFNTLSLIIDQHYHDVLFSITDSLTEDELSEQGFNLEFAKRLAPFVAKHILKRYLKVSGKDARLKRNDKNIIVLNFDITNVNYFIALIKNEN